jgi:hypothetical protein
MHHLSSIKCRLRTTPDCNRLPAWRHGMRAALALISRSQWPIVLLTASSLISKQWEYLGKHRLSRLILLMLEKYRGEYF